MKIEKRAQYFIQNVGAGLSRDRSMQPQSNRGINPLLHKNQWKQRVLKANRTFVRVHCISLLFYSRIILWSLPSIGSTSLVIGAQQPNILLIMSDDHSTRGLSVYGSYRNTTPNMDRLAHQGMRLTQCFAVNSICGPSRAAILTGKYGHKNGFRRNLLRFDGSQTTFPKLLQKAGYQTALVGKWHLSRNDAKNPPTGFDYWNILPGQGDYYDPDMFDMGERKSYKGYATTIITEMGLEFLKKRDPDKPFLLMVHHKAPHSPWGYSAKHENMYDGKTMPEPPTLWDDYATRSEATRSAQRSPMASLTASMQRDDWATGRLEDGGATDPVKLKRLTYQKFLKDYMRTLASVDDSVGALTSYIDSEGLKENTIVIYTSDQGFFLGEHGWHNKRFFYEDAIRMPFIVRYPPEIKAGTMSNAMALNIDIAETLLDFAGLPIPPEMQGRSLRPIFRGERPVDWRTSMFYRYYEGTGVPFHYGVRTERYKLIRFHETDEWELYDLHKDALEVNNVYSQAGYSAVVKQMKTKMQRLIRELEVGDSDLEEYIEIPPDSD